MSCNNLAIIITWLPLLLPWVIIRLRMPNFFFYMVRDLSFHWSGHRLLLVIFVNPVFKSWIDDDSSSCGLHYYFFFFPGFEAQIHFSTKMNLGDECICFFFYGCKYSNCVFSYLEWSSLCKVRFHLNSFFNWDDINIVALQNSFPFFNLNALSSSWSLASETKLK